MTSYKSIRTSPLNLHTHNHVTPYHLNLSPLISTILISIFQDSLLVSTSRPMSEWESKYHAHLRNEQPILFTETPIAEEIVAANYSCGHYLLDYSSIDNNSILLKKLFTSKGLATMFQFLKEDTKKGLGRLSSEQTSDFLVHVLSPAPKCYHIEEGKSDTWLPLKKMPSLVLPNTPEDPLNCLPSIPLTRRGKGTKKNILKYKCFILDFVSVAKLDKQSKSIEQFSIKRKNFRLYITKSRKRLLANNTCKRLIFVESKRKYNHFSFPLHAKRLVC